MPKRILKGVVVGASANKTIAVLVERNVIHTIYHKPVRRSKKYATHDEHNKCKVGDIVEIIESAPISKTKKWIVAA
ncbi:MAG: 30S ribosomal protein S17 [Candidatus Midichloria sp.]|nr:MAG: 30S ribosomal protein S17 [Candidatus Midichloria sp.]